MIETEKGQRGIRSSRLGLQRYIYCAPQTVSHRFWFVREQWNDSGGNSGCQTHKGIKRMLIAFSPWKSCLSNFLCAFLPFAEDVGRRCRLFPLNTEILIKSPFRITRLLLENPVVNTRQFIKKVIRRNLKKFDRQRGWWDVRSSAMRYSSFILTGLFVPLNIIWESRISSDYWFPYLCYEIYVLIRSSRLVSDFENWWNALKKRPSGERNNFRQLLNRVLLNILLYL